MDIIERKIKETGSHIKNKIRGFPCFFPVLLRGTLQVKILLKSYHVFHLMIFDLFNIT